jgi:predicted ester cyclase
MLRRVLFALGSSAVVLAAVAAPSTMPAALAAAQEATPAAACPVPTRADLERVPLAWQEGLDGGDLAPIRAVLDPEVIHHGATFDAVGVDASLQGLQSLLDGFPDVTWRLDQVIVDAPYVAATWHAGGTHTGTFQGIAPTGRSADWTGINVWRVACGAVVETWSELDQVGRLRQLGLRPAAEATPAAGLAAGSATPAACVDDGSLPLPRELVTRWWAEGWTAGDPAAFDEILAEDVMHHWATGADTVGPADVAARVAGWREGMPDLAIRYGDIFVDGPYAAAVWTIVGTPIGAAEGAEPVSANGINVFRIECGRIAEVWSEMDALGLERQMQEAATPTP